MLVLDAFKSHLTPEVKSAIHAMNTDPVIIPGRMTYQLQVSDVVLNKPFKDHLKQLHSEWFLARDHILTPTGKIKKPSVALLCQCIKTSWQRICPEVMVKRFKKCCISNAMDGTKDDILCEDLEEVKNVGSKSDEVENGNSQSGEVGNNDSGGDEIENCEDSETK
jgi:hypothetical protein